MGERERSVSAASSGVTNLPYSYQDILLAQEQRLQARRASAVADLESARLREDADGVAYAADEILRVDTDFSRLTTIANQFVAQQQAAAPRNKYNLSDDEVEVARGIAGNDPSLSDDDRERIYAEQRYRHRHLTATGQYGGSPAGRSK
jgi:hypothetical protein